MAPPYADLAAVAPAVHVDGGEAGDGEADGHDGHAGQNLVPHPAGAAAATASSCPHRRPGLPAGTPGLPRGARCMPGAVVRARPGARREL